MIAFRIAASVLCLVAIALQIVAQTTIPISINPAPASPPALAIPTSAIATIPSTRPPTSTNSPALVDLFSTLTGFTTCATTCLGNLLSVLTIAVSERVADACLDPKTPATLENCRKNCPDDNNIFNTIQSFCATVPKESPLPTARVVAKASGGMGLVVTKVASCIVAGVMVVVQI
ncbi:hypothetical protein BC829DRAFT_420769 [Chytridium lagenaria]|nr:hypothetical protein BC829DRAFT_420769 [Chytridium lagenaria]